MALKSADTLWAFCQRMAGAERLGEHKTSALEDFEVRRLLEFEARGSARLSSSGSV